VKYIDVENNKLCYIRPGQLKVLFKYFKAKILENPCKYCKRSTYNYFTGKYSCRYKNCCIDLRGPSILFDQLAKEFLNNHLAKWRKLRIKKPNRRELEFAIRVVYDYFRETSKQPVVLNPKNLGRAGPGSMNCSHETPPSR